MKESHHFIFMKGSHHKHVEHWAKSLIEGLPRKSLIVFLFIVARSAARSMTNRCIETASCCQPYVCLQFPYILLYDLSNCHYMISIHPSLYISRTIPCTDRCTKFLRYSVYPTRSLYIISEVFLSFLFVPRRAYIEFSEWKLLYKNSMAKISIPGKWKSRCS